MTGHEISINTQEGTFGGYLASPTAARGPGVIVIQEIFGVNGFVRAVADEFAARGFFALAPDLFWRIEPNVQLNDKTEADWKRALDLMGKFDIGTGVQDIQAAITYLRKIPGVTGKVGVVGYCLGGRLAYLCATRTDSDASVSYYGVAIEQRSTRPATSAAPSCCTSPLPTNMSRRPRKSRSSTASPASRRRRPMSTPKWPMPSRVSAAGITIGPMQSSPMAAPPRFSGNI